MSNLFYYYSIAICFAHLLLVTNHVSAFSPSINSVKVSGIISQLKLQQLDHANTNNIILATRLSSSSSGDNENLGVIDLTDEDEDDIPLTNDSKQQQQQQAAPFLSQGELSDDPNLLSPDFNDAKQSRVIFYIILTLVPIVRYINLIIVLHGACNEIHMYLISHALCIYMSTAVFGAFNDW